MPQSFYQVYIHIVFSTKKREPIIDGEIRPRVHAYIAKLARDNGCPFVHVGGTEDHVHILVDVGKKASPVELIKKVKQDSSKFVKTLGEQYHHFFWQSGYGAFSVGAPHKEDVMAYIDHQIEHHKKRSFQEELRYFLDKYGITYDEKYMWD